MRLIDTDALDLERIEAEHGRLNEVVVAFETLIDNAPTIDAVEIVRCKDCKFAQNNRYNSRVDGKCSVLCEHVTTEDGRYELKVFRNANDYCSYGERKNED